MERIISADKLPLASFEITTNDDPTLETISLTLFVAGCTRRCEGCQNPDLQILTEYNHRLLDLDDIKKIISDRMCLITSVCFGGGDFLPLYESQLMNLVTFSKSSNLRTILYTGEIYENIDNIIKENVDIIIDGPYNKDMSNNKFPASLNQRCWINGELVNPKNLSINRR